MDFIILLLASHVSVQVALIIEMYANPDGITRELSRAWLGMNKGGGGSGSGSSDDATTLGVTIGMGIFIFLDIAALSLMVQLWMFHRNLKREQLTTYKFITMDAQRRREARRSKEGLERKRDSAKAKALAEKRKGDYLKLHWGGMLAAKCGALKFCDPLQAAGQEAQQQQQQQRTTVSADEENDES